MNTMENGLPVYGGKVGVNVSVGESVADGIGDGVNVIQEEGVGTGGVEDEKL